MFVPLQSFLVNPSNVAPESPAPANSSSSPGSYFTEAAVLAAVPRMFLVMAATYAAVFALAVAVTVGPPEKEVDTEGEKVLTFTWILGENFHNGFPFKCYICKSHYLKASLFG